ncbi:hypothetical protein BDW02DRAFT_125600 [Decorospora gaudefroyi]|uniref:Secreted protein n=1 Tax=Decorospora gaudefroyi TaxID=184978 RepID=A0A6A5JZK6_9PLEO|nr:hypothetical protein BDW02DRAFT_125600 [Decorospora gaudefroyi]
MVVFSMSSLLCRGSSAELIFLAAQRWRRADSRYSLTRYDIHSARMIPSRVVLHATKPQAVVAAVMMNHQKIVL